MVRLVHDQGQSARDGALADDDAIVLATGAQPNEQHHPSAAKKEPLGGEIDAVVQKLEQAVLERPRGGRHQQVERGAAAREDEEAHDGDHKADAKPEALPHASQARVRRA